MYSTGWIEDPVDLRDYDFLVLSSSFEDSTKSEVDLRDFCSNIHNQKRTSSCVAQCIVSAFELLRIKQLGGEKHVDLSRLFLYFMLREMRGRAYPYKDIGGFIRHGLYIVGKLGICAEKEWPFSSTQVNIRPSLRATMKAYEHRCGSFYRIKSKGDQRIRDVRSALASGYPVCYGTKVGQNWFDYRGSNVIGKVLGKPKEKRGGHATLLVGYQNDDIFIGQNSWGKKWGASGFYYVEPEVIADSELSRDFWVVTGPWESREDRHDTP